ncbi:MAG: hypothetical protein ACXQS5_05810 [Candidatus Methanospirareceae archaeon]
MNTPTIKDPDSIVIDNKVGILDPDQEGTVLDIFRYYTHKLESDRKTNPEHLKNVHDLAIAVLILSMKKQFSESWLTPLFLRVLRTKSFRSGNNREWTIRCIKHQSGYVLKIHKSIPDRQDQE